MALNDPSARLQYLHRAAQLLSDKAPTTSAVLESQYDKTIFENRMPKPEIRRTEICASCGSPLGSQYAKTGPGRILKQSKRAAGEQDHSPSMSAAVLDPKSESRMIYECPRCSAKSLGFVSAQPQPKPPAIRAIYGEGAPPQGQASPGLGSLKPSAPSTTAQNSKTSPAKAISKKRVKGIKSGGLQAMLAKRKESPGSGTISSFDLMDFMKSA